MNREFLRWPGCTIRSCNCTRTHESRQEMIEWSRNQRERILDGGHACCMCHEKNPYACDQFECDKYLDQVPPEAIEQAIESILRREPA